MKRRRSGEVIVEREAVEVRVGNLRHLLVVQGSGLESVERRRRRATPVGTAGSVPVGRGNGREPILPHGALAGYRQQIRKAVGRQGGGERRDVLVPEGHR